MQLTLQRVLLYTELKTTLEGSKEGYIHLYCKTKKDIFKSPDYWM